MGSSPLLLLLKEAEDGDIEFIRKAHEECAGDPRSYFLGQQNSRCRNLLHEAVRHDRYAFLFEAFSILSSHPELVIELVCQQDGIKGNNPIHYAAGRGNIFILKLLVNAYAKAVSALGNYQGIPPWLAKNSNEETPLSCSLKEKMSTRETVSRYLVSQDEHLLRTLGEARYPMEQCSTRILDKQHQSVVFLGMQKGYSYMVEQILTSDLPYSVSGSDGETPLHYASKCNEKVSRLLLEKHPELIKKVSSHGKTMLDHAVEDGTTWLVKLMLTQEAITPGVPWMTKACRRLIWRINREGDTPIHIAARNGDMEISKLLTQGYKVAIQDEAIERDDEDDDALPDPETGNDLMGVNPLYVENSKEYIPLVIALQKKLDDYGVMLSKETFPLIPNSRVHSVYQKSLVAALENGCLLSAKMIVERLVNYGIRNLGNRLRGLGIYSPCVLKMFGHIAEKYPETQEMIKTEEFEKLLVVFPRFRKEKQKDAQTILKEASERGEDWLVRLALDSDKHLLKGTAPAWKVACEKGNLSTLLIFLESFNHQEFIELCKEKKQTPLHHIKLLQQPEEYVKLLKMPVLAELKNQIDSDGATPLHRAIQRDDLELTKALLETKGIEVSIKDNNGITALHLLQKRCRFSTSWGKMCRQIEEDSTVEKLEYLYRKIAFEGMQNSLSVVAALVATITFAAGFTVPGGPDIKDGAPVLATKAAFLVFSVSNTIAMCSSIMVLFLLLGPLMWDPHPPIFYVNLCLSLLLMSLGGTLLAFMTGVYASMAPKAKWVAVFVNVSCSLALVMGCIVLLLTYSPRFKKLSNKIGAWFRTVSCKTIVVELVKASPVTTPDVSHLGGGSSNTLVTETSSGTLNPTSDEVTIEINPR